MSATLEVGGNVASGRGRHKLTPEQRAASIERLSRGRATAKANREAAAARGEPTPSRSPRCPVGMVTVRELSKAVGIAESTLAAWTREGKIPCLPVGILRCYSVDAVKSAILRIGSNYTLTGEPLTV